MTTSTNATPTSAPIENEKRTTYTFNGQPYLYVTTSEVSGLTTAELKKKSNEAIHSLSAGLVVVAVVASLALVAFAVIAGVLAWNSNGALSSFAAALLAYVFAGISYFYVIHDKMRVDIEEATALKFKKTATLAGRLFLPVAHYIGLYAMPIALVATWSPNIIGGLLAAILYMTIYLSIYSIGASQAAISKKVSLAVFKRYGSVAPFETEEEFDLRMTKIGAKKYDDDYNSVVISL